MGATPVVLDISSDEELGKEDFEDFGDSKFPEPKPDDFEWLSKIIRETGDSDEVMVVGEVNPIKQRSKSKPLNQYFDDSSDDCVILDGDPEKVVAVENDSANDGDELMVVGEKGQIPCRDFPHSRHLCAKLPFNSTPHEQRCALCHCYVCDSIAPCVFWGTGALTTDHCHATDKAETWKIKRREFQLRKSASLQAPKLQNSSPTTIRPQPNRVPPRNIIQLAPNSIPRTGFPMLNSRPQNHNFRATELRPCSTSGNFTRPSILLPRRNQPVVSRSKVHHRSFPPHSLAFRNNVIQRERSPNISKLGSHFVPSSLLCKRKVSGRGDLPADQAVPQNSNSTPVSQYSASPVTLANPIDPSSWTGVSLYNHQSSPNMNNVVTSTLISEVELSHQPTFQSSNVCEKFYLNQNQGTDQNVNQVSGFDQDASQNDFLLETRSESSMFHVESNSQNANEHAFQLGNQIDTDINWMNDQSQSNSQCAAENPQYTGSTYDPFLVKDPNPHFTEEFNANPLHLDSFENWPVPSSLFEPNILSAEPTSIDAGMLVFDFETSWNGLTQS